jgi:hypothetical protein
VEDVASIRAHQSPLGARGRQQASASTHAICARRVPVRVLYTVERARLRLLLGLEYGVFHHGAFQNLTPSVQRESALQRLCYPFGRRSLGDSTKTGRLLVVSLRV